MGARPAELHGREFTHPNLAPYRLVIAAEQLSGFANREKLVLGGGFCVRGRTT
jgi:hypothetical protein